MRNRRSGIGVIGYHGCVYALGGFNGITRMNTGEMFNVSTNQWRSVPEMYNPRSNFAVEVSCYILHYCMVWNKTEGSEFDDAGIFTQIVLFIFSIILT